MASATRTVLSIRLRPLFIHHIIFPVKEEAYAQPHLTRQHRANGFAFAPIRALSRQARPPPGQSGPLNKVRLPTDWRRGYGTKWAPGWYTWGPVFEVDNNDACRPL